MTHKKLLIAVIMNSSERHKSRNSIGSEKDYRKNSGDPFTEPGKLHNDFAIARTNRTPTQQVHMIDVLWCWHLQRFLFDNGTQ